MHQLLTCYRLRGAGILALLFSLLIVPSTMGKTWRVPSEHATICGAVDSASYGDTVLVEPGTYYRERRMLTPGGYVWILLTDGVTLVSELGPEATILVETSDEMGITSIKCDSIVDARVRGFTIVDANPLPAEENWDAAVGIVSSDVVIEDNIIHHFNTGIWVLGQPPHSDTPVIKDNEIYDCLYGIELYEVWTRDCPSIIDNHIHDCSSVGMKSTNSAPYVGFNTISNNGGVGLAYLCYGDGLIEGNKIINNGWAGVYADMDYAYNTPCLNCRHYRELANDVYGNGEYDVYYDEETGLGLFEATFNYWGTLCPEPLRFYGRVNWSPWVDSTHTVLCSDCDTCHHETNPTTWGNIKVMFK